MSDTQRRACVLVPLFSIRTRSGYGLGEVPDIPRFARWAADAGFRVLQLLPVGEVCGGETSPYAAASAFALDPVYLGLDDCEDFAAAGGRASLSPEDRATLDELAGASHVAWDRVRALKDRAARRAFERFTRDEWPSGGQRVQALSRFREQHAAWLADYALFAVLHDRFAKSWVDWPAPLRDREPGVLAAARAEHDREILYKTWLQWQLDEQWQRARRAAEALGVALKGDLPFVTSGDSADVWAHRGDFRLDGRVGTPPDAFSAEGQDWGLPLYDWDRMRASGFAWHRARAARAGELYALYRVDHVIGLYRTFYRSTDGKESGFVPAEEDDQIRLGETILKMLADAGEVVAEDLGMVPEFLRPSLERLGIPGYKVLRWERDEVHQEDGKRLVWRDPAGWSELSVATSSTHDVEMHAQWYDGLPEAERAALAAVPGLEALAHHPRFDDVVRDALLRVLYASPSELVAITLQDALGSRERVNVPGTVSAANWTFRMPMDVDALAADRPTTERLARLAAETRRTARH